MTRIHNESVWTTVVTIQIENDVTDSTWQAILKESTSFLHDVDRVFSPFRQDSYLNLIANESGFDQFEDGVTRNEFRMYVPYVNETFTSETIRAYEVVESLCAAAQWKTNGAFNAWRNNIYDPIGLVKGWAADYLIEILQSYNITRAFINAGGDIACMTDDEPWRIALENPSDPMTAIGFLDITNGALCTSGTYTKGKHIETRNNQHDFVSVTISGPSAALADAYATAAIADGLVAFDWIETLGSEWGAIAVSEDSTTLYTHNWHFADQYFSRK